MMLFVTLTSLVEFLRRKSGVVLHRLESSRTKEAARAATSPLRTHAARENEVEQEKLPELGDVIHVFHEGVSDPLQSTACRF